MKIESKILLPHVYLLTFPTQYELCMSMVRMQEFYESPKYRGKYFTLEEYMDYWCKTMGKGVFTYTSVWNGFNLPGHVVDEWSERFCNDYRAREADVLEAIDELIFQENDYEIWQKYYVIAVSKKDGKGHMDHVIEHETAHALYYLYPEYKKSCKDLLKKIPKRQYTNAKRILLNTGGYSRSVVDDELQAYYSGADVSFTPHPEFVDNFRNFKKNLK